VNDLTKANHKILAGLAVLFCVISAACDERSASRQPEQVLSTPVPSMKHEWGQSRFDVCALLTRDEVGEVAGQRITETKSAGGADDSLFISQCFYMTENMAVAAVISVIEKDSGAGNERSPNDLWQEMFGGRKRETRHEEVEVEEADSHERLPPQKITDMGVEAYWKTAGLYALKGNRILRITISGEKTAEDALAKAKTLAGKALPRL